MSASQVSTPRLQVRRTFAAPREGVFRAWTQAEELTRWFAPSDEWEVAVSELELRVGGTYRIEMLHKGTLHLLTGTYREIVPPEKLVFTWRWEDVANCPETLVTVQFAKVDQSTEVVITHEFFVSDEDRKNHAEGWQGCVERFSRTYGV